MASSFRSMRRWPSKDAQNDLQSASLSFPMPVLRSLFCSHFPHHYVNYGPLLKPYVESDVLSRDRSPREHSLSNSVFTISAIPYCASASNDSSNEASVHIRALSARFPPVTLTDRSHHIKPKLINTVVYEFPLFILRNRKQIPQRSSYICLVAMAELYEHRYSCRSPTRISPLDPTLILSVHRSCTNALT